jgi:hypothetical protein
MADLKLTTVPSDWRAALDSLNLEAEQFIGAALKERFTVLNPNGGIRTEVRDIVIDQKSATIEGPANPKA